MNYVISIIIGAALGLFGGYALFNTPAPAADTMKTDDRAMATSTAMGGEMAMEHKAIPVDASKPVPGVSLETFKDSMSGYNIHVTTTNYTFTPEKAGEAAVANEGHAHVYVNGVKVSRLYGEWMNIDGKYFKSGANTIKVTLNANDHSDWELNGKDIEATAEVAY